jgi:hypothetical protein
MELKSNDPSLIVGRMRTHRGIARLDACNPGIAGVSRMRGRPIKSVAIIALLALTGPTFAGGDAERRIADTASIRSCEGKLIEEVGISGNMHGFGSGLTLACMKSQAEASWVLITGTSCWDYSDKPRKCSEHITASVPRLIVDENFWEAKDTPSNEYPMIYNMLKYALGETCKIGEQKYSNNGHSYNSDATEMFWQCENLSVHDGIEDFTKQKWKVYRLTTNSRIPFRSISGDSTFDPQTDVASAHFVIPASNYQLHIDEYQ